LTINITSYDIETKNKNVISLFLKTFSFFCSLIDRRGIYTEDGQISQRYHYGTVKGAQTKVN